MTTEVTTTEAPGNTNTGALVFRGRAFQFTLNEICWYDDIIEILQKLKTCDYLISCQEEAPTTGHEHVHIYAHFSQPYKLPQKLLKYGMHIEICRGSPKQNIAYIRKDGHILDEWGEEPHQGAKTIEDLKALPINEVPPQYYHIKKELDEDAREEEGFMNMLTEIENDECKAPFIFYITGPSGAGKTRKAYATALGNFDKKDIGRITINNNFCKFTNKNAKCFVIEEFRDSQMHAADFLQMTDRYGYNANTKGGFVYMRPEMLIICSIIEPEDLYHDEINQQVLRRITKIIRL